MKDRKVSYMSYNEYISRCVKANVDTDLDQTTLVEFLHDLGIVICFKELKDTMVFNPEWVTKGVYAIIDNPEIIKSKGRLDRKALGDILDKTEYPPSKHRFIIEMMRQFQLCVDIMPDKMVLIPDLLPIEEPDTGRWENTLNYYYQYGTYLRRIMTHFIVNMYQKRSKETYWRNGIVLDYKGNRALIKANVNEKKISICIDGNTSTRQRTLEVIRREFEKIHSTFANLKVTEYVAHPKYPEAIADYDELLAMEADGVKMKYVKELRRELPIKDWLEGVATPEDLQKYRFHGRDDAREFPENIHVTPQPKEPQSNIVALEIKKQEIVRSEAKIAKLRKDKSELEAFKQKLDDIAGVWATVIRWSVGLLLLASVSYFVYWIIKNFNWIKDNWTEFEIVFWGLTIVISTLFIAYFLFRKQKISEEITISWVEARTEKILYWKNGFEIRHYQAVCQEIELCEGEVEQLRNS